MTSESAFASVSLSRTPAVGTLIPTSLWVPYASSFGCGLPEAAAGAGRWASPDTCTVTVAVFDAHVVNVPALTQYWNVSMPTNPGFGVYVGGIAVCVVSMANVPLCGC